MKVMFQVKKTNFINNYIRLFHLDLAESSSVTGGFYSNCFDGIIKLSNETWHIEPTRKYGDVLVDSGPSIIYNALDVDMTKYNSNNPFRSKRYVIDENEESSSFCGLDQNEKREKMKKEVYNIDKDFIQALFFRLFFHQTGTRHHQNAFDIIRHFPSFHHCRGCTQIFNTRIGARSDKDLINFDFR